MSSSGALITGSPDALTANPNQTVTFYALISDTAGQQMAPGTSIVVSTTYDGSVGPPSYTQLDGNDPGLVRYSFQIKGDGTPGSGTLRVDVTSPRGVTTSGLFNVN